jgi:hypothetical protein
LEAAVFISPLFHQPFTFTTLKGDVLSMLLRKDARAAISALFELELKDISTVNAPEKGC